MENLLKEYIIPYVSLDSCSVDNLLDDAAEMPQIILGSVEAFLSDANRKILRQLKVEYVAVDECQVLNVLKYSFIIKIYEYKVIDPHTGWSEIRPYDKTTWEWISATWPTTPWLLCSATLKVCYMYIYIDKIGT